MEEDKGNHSYQSPSPLPTCQEDQACSRQCMGTEGSSDQALLETEKEGALVNTDKEWKDDEDQELSQWGNIGGREFCLWEEVSAQEFYQWQEVTAQWEVGVRVHWGGGTQQELYYWEENVTVQEFYPWEEDYARSQELSQWEEDLKYQELSLWEGERYQDMSLLEDVQGHLHRCQWEVDKRDSELSQVGENSEKELSQGKCCNVQELPQWEKDMSVQKLSQKEESVNSQGQSQWGEGVNYKTWDKLLHTENDEDAQTCGQQGRGSLSSLGTQVSGEAACELLSASAATASSTEAEPAGVAALAGGAEERDSAELLAPKEEKSSDSSVLSDEVPSLSETESPVPAPHSPLGCSPALLGLAQSISSEVVYKAVPVVQESGQQPEKQRDLEQSTASELEAAAPVEREESPISVLHSPYCAPSPSPCPLGPQVLSEQQEEANRGLVLAEEESKRGTLAGELELSQSNIEEDPELSQQEMNKYQEVSQREICTEQELSPGEVDSSQELSPGEACTEEELSPGEAGSYQELSPGEACTEKELSPGEAGSYQEWSQGEDSMEQELYPEESRSYLEFSDWEECVKRRLPQGEVSSSRQLSDWEEYTEQELSHKVSSYQELSEFSEEEDSIGQEVPKGNINRSSMQSSWEKDRDKELMQDSWKHMSVHNSAVKPLLQEDKWDDLSVLELSEEEDRDHRLGCFAKDRFPVPAPREAWVEHSASEPCPHVPLRVSLPHVKAQAPRGRAVSRGFRKQVPGSSQRGAQVLRWQPAPRKKQPSFLSRVVRRLFHCPCLAPQPED